MAKSLIIVESPAKVKTIKKFLGDQYIVQASVGHIRDLPKKVLGVDEANGFMPVYEVIDGKQKVVDALRSAASKVDTVYLAPDPDREGEAIAWHIAELIKDKAKVLKRIQFNEITSKAVKEALTKPREINYKLFEAQQARRILDRLVGYKISPILWKTVKRGVSAGRVQSVALRLIVEREEERVAFVPEEFWTFKALLLAQKLPKIKADLAKINKKKAVIPDGKTAEEVKAMIQGKDFIVRKIEEKERLKAPQAPFITSTLQQIANSRLGFAAKRTMNIAQKLYEGLDLGQHGTSALITYMRTDSTRISDEAKEATAEFITKTYGSEYLSSITKKVTKKANTAPIQDAHEAIRPVDVTLTPELVQEYLSPEQYRLYNLIWSRFVASQMAHAKYHDTKLDIECGVTEWKAKGERLLFAGFQTVLSNKSDDEDSSELPKLELDEVLKLDDLKVEQKFTQPSPRFTEASLVRELEEQGIGRPSTYAAIISTLQDREYVTLEEKYFAPTELGNIICTKLRDNFQKLMDIHFTADMETNLDKIALGELSYANLLTDFNTDLDKTIDLAITNMGTTKSGYETELDCPECSKKLMVKFGKAGSFLACSNYPECRFTSNFERDEQGVLHIKEREKPNYEVVGKCPKCQGDVVVKKARSGGRFLSCINYPTCDYASSFSTGVPCPNEGCKGTLVEKNTKKGKIFYSCNEYPKCDYALWDKPLAEACPLCESPVLVHKYTNSKGNYIACPNPKCKYKRDEE